ncbi:MAG: single-stranded DNA-binding protein [Bacteroidia bacterium]|jgi:single-strand DNA-binding protein|nr:single-stranded DNA-binding protein [Bacteroidia bacterium]MCC6768674.1 single-stranded DNA-binding protein [Bacteroidia bacterium]
MAGVNKVILIGNVGKDPEVKVLDNGVRVANFPLATTEIYKKDGVRHEQTEWHNIVLWRGLAEVTEKIVKKGATVYIEGKLRSRTWEDKDKVKRYSVEVVADTLTLLASRKDEGSHPHHEDVITVTEKDTHSDI